MRLSDADVRARKREYDLARYRLNGDKQREKSRLWRRNNREKSAAMTARWRAKQDPEAFRARDREKKRAWMGVPENRMLHTLRGAKARATKAGIPFDIMLSDLLPLPTHCPVLGIEINYRGNGHGFVDNSPSIDRIIPKLGYVKGNVRLISWRANHVKTDATLEELEAVIVYLKNAGVCHAVI